MTEDRPAAAVVLTTVAASAEPPPPGGRDLEPPPVKGVAPVVPGTPPVAVAIPLPAEPLGKGLPGVQLSRRPHRRGDGFGWPSNAAPGKPEGEVDTRP